MRYLSFLFLCLVLSISCKQKKAETTETKEEPAMEVVQKPATMAGETGTWTSLFNGKDLTGWNMKIVGHKLGENFGNTFRVEDGILSIRYDAYEDNFDNRFGALYYDKKLSNYRLKVEYRFVGETCLGAPEWGYRDSGVQYHCQPPETVGLNQSFPVSLEYNLHGGNGTDERPVGEICAGGTLVEVNGAKNTSYCTPATVKRTFHGDQWVTMEIEIKDGTISHYVNGEKILTYTNPTYDPNHEIGKTFIVDGNDQVKDGYISLQSNSHPIDFRSIELLEY
ncbi:hypothetical protein GGR42_000344 [Saonia flava]|uniref:3-keto-alpha-glucoside-1,2-lyase/3-keto-2-hydroxy-glucal hydratase domain-containing protein n=1 Tax=Saonia flava TaxID=523696 RepID=A0A846QTP6_9FLAO|nr:DUF1080 domain-containing protein [Saonia flava]NJB69882.1 hypothetical protein [Saonia flava]